ncbi:glucans biosynthesis glucosyltransferase MdoH [Vibrio cholerae]|nr:glucans biosynthesis glucosyltransferase MdoH [Vibrio cholerae]EGR2828512.1 glucans biosynthesis glucosyltransferase MdoH [Vibrio cholerae]EJL6291235.1 glucans biosynthesis glucosyltransferase MdoH [Vibrio cholerae]ELO1825528.1 glucans biosynthesis glucosyltransferase MdoH [Vibrio cholerae]MCX9440921.1 glucans biosynthesis glucosyltransferase MdoH [Vibrio cholerae]
MTNPMVEQGASQLMGGSAMPPEQHGEMPEQNLKRLSEGFPRDAIQTDGVKSCSWRRVFVVGFALLISAFAIFEMRGVFLVGGLTPIEYAVLVLFAINFCWIALAFSSSIAGFFVLASRKPAPNTEQPLTTRTAILMPTYNEAPDRVFAAVETMALALAKTEHGHAFDWFILSDTTDPEVALSEEQAFWLLRQQTAGKTNVYYRRRRKNIARKAGNIADFCRRWGSGYDHLLVLDADSVMQPSTMISLAQRMQSDPDAGLIQTIPALINGTTLMARVQQFAARIYGPVVGTGLAWWVQKEGNFWGHNAIIRTEAFMSAAGLPHLSGRPPFGGHILSHDFVEAALIRRAGWSVTIAADLSGSFEECPPSIIDLAVRDRRWCQGNLQHSRIIGTKGLHWISRLHLTTGIMSYLSSPFWLLLILSGLLLALQAHFIRPEYFTEQFSLFPTWPVMDSARALQLFYITMGILFSPKIFGLLLLMFDGEMCRTLGGRLRVILSAVTEILLSALVAPIMMLIHCGAVVSILFGRDSGWAPQRRDDGSLPIKDLLYRHRWHMTAGVLLGYAAMLDSWTLLAWMSPALIGLWFSVPLSGITASYTIGAWFKQKRILATPEEIETPAIVLAAQARRDEYVVDLQEVWNARMVLADHNLIALHIAMMDKLPSRQPGTAIEPLDAVARIKVQEAESQESLLALLTKVELSYVLGNPLLIQQVAKLPPSLANQTV